MKQPAWLTRKLLIRGAAFLIVGGTAITLIYGIKAGSIKAGFEPDETVTKSEKRDKQGNITETTTTTTFQDAKTLWDWLSLLGVPLSLAVLGYVLQQLQQARIEKQSKVEKEIAESNQREEALQNYLDRLSELLIDKNVLAMADKVQKIKEQGFASVESPGQLTLQVPIELHKQTGQEIELLNAAQDVVRARTLSILRRLGQDGERKGDVIRFLIEAEVTSKLKLNLSGANLSGMHLSDTGFRDVCLSKADFSNTNLCRVDLRYANLSEANFSNANLLVDFSNTDLSGVNFFNTNFKEVRLFSANLSDADLRNANLSDVNLRGTNLSNANLEGANLSNANLGRGVQGWTGEQIAAAKLCNTTLPEGCNLNPNRDCRALGLSPALPMQKHQRSS